MAHNQAQINGYVHSLGTANATHCSAEEAAASVILNSLAGYNHRSKHRAADLQRIESAIVAYAKLLQDAGVKV